MFHEVDRVKERRRERIERIRTQMRDSMPPYLHELNDPIDQSYQPNPFPGFLEEEDEPKRPRIPPQDMLGIQTIGSLLLIGLAYLVFQSPISMPVSVKESAQEVMTRDFNFAGVANWYESTFGNLPSVLPAFAGKEKAVAVQAGGQLPKWTAPSTWKLIQPFDAQTGRMIVDTGAVGTVLNAEKGWVTFVGEKEGLGLTVVVQYANKREVWFANLEQATVAVNDFVYAGHSVGVAATNSAGERRLMILMRERDRFVDPAGVIALE